LRARASERSDRYRTTPAIVSRTAAAAIRGRELLVMISADIIERVC
jgi:hypothetical protein